MIDLLNVTIDYPLESFDGDSLKADIINLLQGRKKSRSYYRALHDISLTISNGERVGLVGLNGAGKSTLLRVLSRIYQPTQGTAHIIGSVSPLLDLATGLELHHTGLENIRIRLMFLGVDNNLINEMIDEIVEFTELGEFIHQPARTYSSGMFMRLAFATSTAIKPEILIADEIIGAGDLQFATKAKQRLERLLSGDQTTILSSHSLDLVRSFCDRVIWLDHGKIIADGDTSSVLKEYENKAPSMHR
jgi:ABC-type polysaccharide/polyol phosphate transport system ATPase subunit